MPTFSFVNEPCWSTFRLQESITRYLTGEPLVDVVPNIYDRCWLAWNINILEDYQEKILEELSRDPNSRVRSYAASRPDTPVHILEELASDHMLGIRCAIAENPSTPATLLHRLSKEEFWLIRRVIAYHDNTSLSTLQQLLRDRSFYVREAAKTNLKHRE